MESCSNVSSVIEMMDARSGSYGAALRAQRSASGREQAVPDGGAGRDGCRSAPTQSRKAKAAPLITPAAQSPVDKVCGKPTGEPSTMPPNWSEVTTSRMTSPPLSPTPPSSQEALGKLAHLRSSFYSKHSLRATTREFLMYLQRYKSFFSVLPEMLCEGDNVVDDSTCWSGGDVVEREQAAMEEFREALSAAQLKKTTIVTNHCGQVVLATF
ncbi:unnamed protein product [Arctogadus glacialis]